MSIQLYPGIAFSPQAALADNIGAADTIIKVTDVSAFPDAPNLATIGTDEEGETVLYAAKTADALSGCVRGVEGTAKVWSAGELIGRNFTAKDHADLISAVQNALGVAGAAQDAAATAQSAAQAAQGAADTASQNLSAHNEDQTAHEDIREELDNKQPILTGQPGQVVGFNSDGAAQAVRGWSNPNLLDNWYFLDPINQKGQTQYQANGYTIDRWIFLSGEGAISLNDNGITISSISGYSVFAQMIENENQLAGKTVTFSALSSDNQLKSATIVFPEYDSEKIRFDNECYISFVLYGDAHYAVRIVAIPGTSITICAVKLELGPTQTLAHQDADGNWVLNDPPPDKTLEMLKCQRYYRVFSEQSRRPTKAMDFCPPMRINPTMGTIKIGGVTYYTADANL